MANSKNTENKKEIWFAAIFAAALVSIISLFVNLVILNDDCDEIVSISYTSRGNVGVIVVTKQGKIGTGTGKFIDLSAQLAVSDVQQKMDPACLN